MANLSQQKRQRMLEFLQTLREEHKDEDTTLAAIGEIETELNAKKYGLVWEEHVEKVDIQMQDNIPVFSEVAEREINKSESCDYNFLLEGDNLHSLYLLEKTHKGKIDVIYIDPPYNTGNSFTYNDEIIDDLDSFKHSKWISFMTSRLNIAKQLLKPEGFLWISIDETELFNVKLLIDEIFGPNNFRSLITVISNPGGRDYGGIAKTTEYVLVYSRSENGVLQKVESNERTFTMFDEIGGFELRELRNRNIKFNDQNRPNLCYPFYVDPDTKDENGLYSIALEKSNKFRVEVMPLVSQGVQTVWRWGKEQRSRKNLNTNIKAKLKRDGTFMIVEKYRDDRVMLKNSLTDKCYRTENGSVQIKDIFGYKKFDYPKPTEIPSIALQTYPNKNATVLDFFAGSGTTGQAVLELNKQDGGNRKFILCTNNENNICENITYQRLKTVITGLRQDGSEYSKGISSNLKYYKTGFVAKDEEFLSDALLDHIKEMVQLEHGVRVDGTKHIIVMSEEEVDELEANWNDYKNVEALYVSRNVLLSTQQNAKFKNVDIYVIPDYYFNFELKEVGLSW